MNQQVLSSDLLNRMFVIRSVPISYARSLSNLGKLGINKFIVVLKIFLKLLSECIFHRPGFIYFQLSPLGIAFYRDLIFVILIKLFNIKIIYHLHGKGIKELSRNKLNGFFYRYAFRNSEIISLSNLLKNDLIGVFKRHVYVVNNGIPDFSGEKTFYPSCNKENGIIQILFLSHLFTWKGICEFIDSLKILSYKGIDFNANIIGAEGDVKVSYIFEKLSEYSLMNKVTYMGLQSGMEKYISISNCDVLVYPTLNDAFPLVLLEVMQFSKPVIATREGAISEIVDHGITGFLMNRPNPEQIAEKLGIFIKNPELGKIMGEAGRKKYLEKYTLEIFEKNMAYVFNDVMKKIS